MLPALEEAIARVHRLGAVAGVVVFNGAALGPGAFPGGWAYAAGTTVPAEMAVAINRLYAVGSAVAGGWLGEHVSLRASLGFAGASALVVTALAWRLTMLRGVRELPKPESADDALGAEAMVSILPVDSGHDDAAAEMRREAIDRVGDQPVQPPLEQAARS